MLGPGEPVDGRHAETYDLRVIRKRIDHAQPLVDVVERRNPLHAFPEILLSRGRPQHQVVDALGKEMIERVDIAHAQPPPTYTARARLNQSTMDLWCNIPLSGTGRRPSSGRGPAICALGRGSRP